MDAAKAVKGAFLGQPEAALVLAVEDLALSGKAKQQKLSTDHVVGGDSCRGCRGES
jgi:hypothetical protein